MGFDQEKTQATTLSEPGYRENPKRQLDRARCDGQNGGCERAMSSAEILAELFSYHPPTELTLPKFAAINQAAKNFAEVVLQNCPSGKDRSRAIEMIRDARMVANACVALNGVSL